MAQDEDRLAGLDAKIAALADRTRRGLADRADAVAEAIDAWRDGRNDASVVRRLAHKLRGAAEDPGLRAMAEAVETAAANDQPPDAALVAKLVARAHEVAREKTASQTPKPTTTRRARILVVDDDEAILRMISMTLERVGGHEVVAASTSTEAMRALDERSFDVILLDAMMPDKNGFEMCGEARQRERQRDATIVVLSAANQSQLGWPTRGGPDHWWLKPMPASVLVEQIAKLVDASGNPERST